VKYNPERLAVVLDSLMLLSVKELVHCFKRMTPDVLDEFELDDDFVLP
jgi:hypothetical protein